MLTAEAPSRRERMDVEPQQSAGPSTPAKVAVLVLGIAATVAVAMCANTSSNTEQSVSVQSAQNAHFWDSDLAAARDARSAGVGMLHATETELELGEPKKGFDVDEFLKSLFIDVTTAYNEDEKCDILDSKYYKDGCPFKATGLIHILLLLLGYGFVLFQAADLIGDGSELLLCVPSYKQIVGTVVLPVLGAVPDGMIVLFSGLGPPDKVQAALSVGVGAIAGSTIMLLTLPWAVVIYSGRVTLKNTAIDPATGAAKFTKLPTDVTGKKMKLDPKDSKDVFGTGIVVDKSIASTGKIMLLTAVPYVLIQGSAFSAGCGFLSSVAKHECKSVNEHVFALLGLIYCVGCFFGYLYYQVRTGNVDQKSIDFHYEQIKTRSHSLEMLVGPYREEISKWAEENKDKTRRSASKPGDSHVDVIIAVVGKFFAKYDGSKDDLIDSTELTALYQELYTEGAAQHEMAKQKAEQTIKDSDKDGNKKLSFIEFVKALTEDHFFTKLPPKTVAVKPESCTQCGHKLMPDAKFCRMCGTKVPDVVPVRTDEGGGEEGGEEDEEDEEDGVPDDLKGLSAEDEQAALLKRSFFMMGAGTLLVLLFSDPMVDVLSGFGNAVGLGPFYAAFVLAPVASNASEILAAYKYGKKKTVKDTTIALSTLQGAACMNNSFCLAIFLALMYFKRLTWEFSAETLSILAVELLMAFISFRYQTMNLLVGGVVLSAFPLSLVLVAVLEKMGLN